MSSNSSASILNLLWVVFILCCLNFLGISGPGIGFFRSDVIVHNIGLWTEGLRNQLVNEDG